MFTITVQNIGNHRLEVVSYSYSSMAFAVSKYEMNIPQLFQRMVIFYFVFF